MIVGSPKKTYLSLMHLFLVMTGQWEDKKNVKEIVQKIPLKKFLLSSSFFFANNVEWNQSGLRHYAELSEKGFLTCLANDRRMRKVWSSWVMIFFLGVFFKESVTLWKSNEIVLLVNEKSWSSSSLLGVDWSSLWPK